MCHDYTKLTSYQYYSYENHKVRGKTDLSKLRHGYDISSIWYYYFPNKRLGKILMMVIGCNRKVGDRRNILQRMQLMRQSAYSQDLTDFHTMVLSRIQLIT